MDQGPGLQRFQRMIVGMWVVLTVVWLYGMALERNRPPAMSPREQRWAAELQRRRSFIQVKRRSEGRVKRNIGATP